MFPSLRNCHSEIWVILTARPEKWYHNWFARFMSESLRPICFIFIVRHMAFPDVSLLSIRILHSIWSYRLERKRLPQLALNFSPFSFVVQFNYLMSDSHSRRNAAFTIVNEFASAPIALQWRWLLIDLKDLQYRWFYCV
jgi:hypothetical protein